ncbi:MAG: GNAT family N-acetyltransferase [Chlamydiales bacterium]
MKEDIEIIPLFGAAVEQKIPEIAKLRIEIFQEYPFLYQGDEDYERRYLKKFSNSSEAIVILSYHGNEIVGISTGLPFREEDPSLHTNFLKHGLEPEEFFYFGESVLKKSYRGQGIGKRFFALRQEHAVRLGYSKLCFCTVIRSDNDPRKPKNYHSLESFWNRMGFEKQSELTCKISWKEIGETAESP